MSSLLGSLHMKHTDERELTLRRLAVALELRGASLTILSEHLPSFYSFWSDGDGADKGGVAFCPGHVWEALRDPFANYVLQKCITVPP